MAATLVGGLLVLAFLAQSPPREPHPVFSSPVPLNIAHSGAQGHAPGDTVEAFDLALDMGADVLEMDAQLTADGQLVVHHDGTVDRQTDGTGAIADMTVEQLQALDAGYGFTDAAGDHPWRGRGVRIPTLVEVLERYPDTPLVIEMKLEGGPDIVEVLASTLEEAGRTEDVIVASFDLELVRHFRELLPGVATNLPEAETRTFYALQLVGLERWWRPPAGFIQVPEYHGDRHVVTERFVRAADRAGVDVHVWTVNEEEDLRRMVDLGVHGIMTDFPDRLSAILDALPERPGSSAGADDRLELVRWLQDRLGWLTPVMRVATFLGDADFYLLVFPLLYWSVSRRVGLRLGVMLLLSAGTNGVLKLSSASPRPLFLDPSVGLVHETTFGIPSGHSQNAVAVWGTLAAELRRRWAWVTAISLMLLLGFSRVHLGAHFPVDTLTGWAAGAVLLLAYLRWRDPVAGWASGAPAGRVLGATFAISLGLIAAGALVRTSFTGWSVPSAWVGAGEPGIEGGATGLSTVVTPSAALFGIAVGVLLVHRRGGFDTAGPVWERVLRYPVGLVGVILLWQGLGAVFPGGETPLALVARYVRYGLVGAWMTGGAPLVFRTLGLAPPAPAPRVSLELDLHGRSRPRSRLSGTARPTSGTGRRTARSPRGSRPRR